MQFDELFWNFSKQNKNCQKTPKYGFSVLKDNNEVTSTQLRTSRGVTVPA